MPSDKIEVLVVDMSQIKMGYITQEILKALIAEYLGKTVEEITFDLGTFMGELKEEQTVLIDITTPVEHETRAHNAAAYLRKIKGLRVSVTIKER